jgi:hypothetical protein
VIRFSSIGGPRSTPAITRTFSRPRTRTIGTTPISRFESRLARHDDEISQFRRFALGQLKSFYEASA